MPRVILVDDDEVVRYTLKHVLLSAGHSVECAADGRKALAAIRQGEFDAAVIDIIMPEMDGIELILELRRAHPHIGIVAISGWGSPERGGDLIEICQKLGAHRALAKPFEPQALLSAIEAVVQ